MRSAAGRGICLPRKKDLKARLASAHAEVAEIMSTLR